MQYRFSWFVFPIIFFEILLELKYIVTVYCSNWESVPEFRAFIVRTVFIFNSVISLRIKGKSIGISCESRGRPYNIMPSFVIEHK